MRLSLKAAGIGLAGMAMVGFLGLMGLGLLNKAPATGLSGLSRLQKPAPEIRMPLFEGGELLLSQYRGQPMVINFWASWCPPCREEAFLLERLWRTYEEEGVAFVGVDIQDTEERGRAFLKEFEITYPNGMDLDGKITVDYGVVGLPVTFFVNRGGVVERRWVGAVRERQLVAWVEEMIAGIAPTGDPEAQSPEAYFKLDRDK